MDPILVLNSGSSTVKYQLFGRPLGPVLLGGVFEEIGLPGSRLLHWEKPGEKKREIPAPGIDHRGAIGRVIDLVLLPEGAAGPRALHGIGHRVVHGGETFSEPALITPAVIEGIRSTLSLAPLHNPANLMGIEAALERCPGVPQVAVFDTAFHQTLPPCAYRYALPREIYRKNRVRRYGFHGTSHAYVARRAGEFLGRPLAQLNLITLHLGNGASAAAIRGGRSVDTSMGLTPLEGLVMGTRSGDLDPAVPFFLGRELGLAPGRLEALLNEESGLKGLAGSPDLRDVLAQARSGDPDAELALEIYAYRIRKYLGAYWAVLGRLDAVVFTAGAGENSPEIRRRACQGLGELGLEIDETRNSSECRIERAVHREGSRVPILVIPTNEELEIARQTEDQIERRPRK